jgi:hypothetical protein
MQVVSELSLRYLWVYLYCVSTDARIKHSQIARMDLVYSCARFTIVAAAGTCTDAGLPDMGSYPRVPQPICKVDDMTFTSLLPELDHVLSLSTWSSRGWTYQEGALSSHQIIFTESQVHFQCPKHSFRESMQLSIEAQTLVGNKKQQKQRDEAWVALIMPKIRSRLSATMPWREHSSTIMGSFMRHITAYTNRVLTYDADALNAVRSIMDAASDMGVLHLCGIPFIAGHQDANTTFA